MSWVITPFETSSRTAKNDIVNTDRTVQGQEGEHVDEAVAAAKKAAYNLVSNGAVGKGVPLRVSLSGHANPNHEPADGWANDYVQVTIYQL